MLRRTTPEWMEVAMGRFGEGLRPIESIACQLAPAVASKPQ